MTDEDAFRLTDFPVEVLTMIFSMTSCADKVNLSQVCQLFDCVLQQRELNRSISLQCSYDLDVKCIYNYMKDTVRCKFITSVNFTSCYWIPSALIKKCLIRLKNLETMLVADTKLTSSDLKALLTALPKVTKLALTWNGPIDIGRSKEELQSVYIYVPTLNWDPSLEILRFLKSCKKLETVSIVGSTIPHEAENYVGIRNESAFLPFLRSVLITVEKGFTHDFSSPLVRGSISAFNKHALAQALTSATNDDFIWESYWLPSVSVVSMYERILYLKRKSKGGEDSLSMDRAFLSASAGGISIADDSVLTPLAKLRSLSISCANRDVDTVIPLLLQGEGRLEELNLYGHYDKKMLSLCRNLTNSSPSYVLRKLSIPACVLWREKSETPVRSDEPLQGLAKRPRISLIKVAETHTSLFQTLVRSCPNIEVFVMDNIEKKFLLELPDSLEWDTEQLIHICDWKKLRKLTLGGMPISSFLFLEKIGRGCPKITALTINYLHLTSSALNMSGIVKALPLFSNLEDLAIRQPMGIPVLHGLRLKSLRRVLLICNKVTGPAIGEFLSYCDKVVFLYLVCDISKAEAYRIKAPLQKRFGDRQALIFHIVSLGSRLWPEEPTEAEAKAIPGIHANDMLTRWNLIAGPNPKETYIQLQASIFSV